MARTRKTYVETSSDTDNKISSEDAGDYTTDLGVLDMRAVRISENNTIDLSTETGIEAMPAYPQELFASGYAETISDSIVGIFKKTETATIPTYGTQGAACFDIYSDFDLTSQITVYNSLNHTVVRRVSQTVDGDYYIILDAGDRALIPTGLIFDIQEGWKLLAYPRSGKSLKEGIALFNSVGVVDHDYTDEFKITIKNESGSRVIIKNKERLAQGEIVPAYKSRFYELETAIDKKLDRIGGFGSTGSA